MGEPKVGVGWSLAGPVIGVSDVLAVFKRQLQIGPFVIVSESAPGLAIDSARHHHNGSQPHLWALHCGSFQQWMFKRTPGKRGFSILSCDNQLALDAQPKQKNGLRILMWEHHNEPWQRWRLVPIGDGSRACMIQSAHDGRVIDVGEGAQQTLNPWKFDAGKYPQQRFNIIRLQGAPALDECCRVRSRLTFVQITLSNGCSFSGVT